MKKILVLMLIPFYAQAAYLPSHFGSELGVIWSGYSHLADLNVVTSSIELEFSSSKLFNDKVIITSVGRLGDEGSGLGLSIFGKVNSFTYIGASGILDRTYTVDPSTTILISIPWKKFIFEPFIQVNVKDNLIPEAGLRLYYSDKFSLFASYFKMPKDEDLKNVHYFRIGFKVPMSNGFGIINEIQDMLDSPEKLKEIIPENVKPTLGL